MDEKKRLANELIDNHKKKKKQELKNDRCMSELL